MSAGSPAPATHPPLPVPPPYTEATLADVLPSVADAIGVSGMSSALAMPSAARAVVLLVDGLGDLLLRARSGHAPFLRSLLADGKVITAGFPTTTATSIGSFGTGLPPGGHGLVGYEVLDPERDRLLNELSWDGDVNPRTWQPQQTVFERVVAAGHDVVRIGPGFFDGSGLTEAALRGGRFIAAQQLQQRVESALHALRASPRGLVYVYWGDVDKVGHEAGCGSWQWGEELGYVDAAVRDLAGGLPSDAILVVTADHGMVDIPHSSRLDLAVEDDLAAGVRHVGGEARALHLYAEAGAAADVLATWRERMAADMWVLSRDEAVAAGWFGPVSPYVLPRIGDVVAAAASRVAVVDSRRQRPELLRLIGLHGSLTPEESLVPLLTVAGRAVG